MRYSHGFSLIELIVVITVISLLAGSMIPTSVAILDIERAKATGTDLSAIQTAIENYYMDNNAFPPTNNLGALSNNPGPGIAPNWRGPYLLPKFTSTVPTDNNVTHDQWRQPFRANQLSATQFMVWSDGINRVNDNGINDGAARDDISRTANVSVYVTTQRRDLAKTQIATFNAAIINYQKYYYNPTGVPPVPAIATWAGNWPAASQQLRSRGVMTLNANNDPWGTPYQFNGTIVTSPNVP